VLTSRLSQLDEADVPFVKLSQKIGVGLDWVLVVHVIVSVGRRQFYADLVWLKIFEGYVNQL
jgi:hypothetical protein